MADTRGKIASNAYLVSFLVHQKLIYVRLNSGSNKRKILRSYCSHTCVILTQQGLEKSLLHNGRCVIAAVAPGVSHAISQYGSVKEIYLLRLAGGAGDAGDAGGEKKA